MRPYQEWNSLADRWQKAVDYASVPSAWSPIMFKIRAECMGDYLLAHKRLGEFRRANQCNTHDTCSTCMACYKIS
jgi:hypothetical protein